VFAQMGVDVGMSEVMKVADELGLDTEGLQAVPAQTLGTMGASPLEMAAVYATLDNHGRKVTPAVIKSAEHKDRTVEFDSPVGEQIISREAADTVTSVLTGVVDDGTARVSVAQAANRKGQQVAGKTGTSDENKSAWFTGYTPGLVTSVGLFGEDTKANKQVSLTGATGLIQAGGGRINGGGYPAKIWATYTFGTMGKVTKFDLDTTLGAGVKLAYFAQHAMEVLEPDKTVYETLQDAFPLANPGQLRSLAGCFGFPGDDIEKVARVLSGGEKARLVLARMLYERPNFLVLDEPTNHLDVTTKDMIVRSLAEYEGTMLFVSHDRHFLAALSNRVLELTPEGIHKFGGGYTEYVQSTGHEAPGLRS
jgi:ABC-type dipeptide/oligopeptide/nickel transport system ATPase component